jgi:hypothetical protein
MNARPNSVICDPPSRAGIEMRSLVSTPQGGGIRSADRAAGFLSRILAPTHLRTQLICPTGASAIFVSSPFSKNISLHGLVETALLIRHPARQRGVSRSSRTCGGMRWTRRRRVRNRGSQGGFPVSDRRRTDERYCCVRRSRVVLTPRRWRQVEVARVSCRPNRARQTDLA